MVKTHVAPAGDKGLGLFAAESLPAGTVWWRDDRSFNKIISKDEYDALPQLSKDFVLHYGYLTSDGGHYICLDDARFQNHSDNPNTRPAGEDVKFDRDSDKRDWIVIRDVDAGEELTADYRQFYIEFQNGLTFENKEK